MRARKSRPTKRAPDVWDSARFTSIFPASSLYCSQVESTPAHTQVTQTVESVDNPDVDIFTVRIDPDSLREGFSSGLLGGTAVIEAKSVDGTPLTLIPYHLWGNRGASQMTVWVNVPGIQGGRKS